MNTQSKTYLYNIIKSNKDTRKDTTINQYVRSIIKITDNLNLTDIKSLEFLQDTKSIDKFINTIQTISTKRNLYTALLSLIKVNEEDKLYLHYKLKETGLKIIYYYHLSTIMDTETKYLIYKQLH